jgi:hypothetical protein
MPFDSIPQRPNTPPVLAVSLSLVELNYTINKLEISVYTLFGGVKASVNG